MSYAGNNYASIRGSVIQTQPHAEVTIKEVALKYNSLVTKTMPNLPMGLTLDDHT